MINNKYKYFKNGNSRFFATSFIVVMFALFTQCFADTNVFLNVDGCNNNNICEAPGENNLNCSNDCTACNFNNVCELLKGETPLSCPSDCQTVSTTSAPSVGGTPGSPALYMGTILNVNIKVGINYALISWDTAVPTFGSVSWGVGDAYNDGIINGTQIKNHHEMVIENLSVARTYSYFINASLPEYYYARNTGNFTTLSIPTIKIIPSISNLVATPSENEILLNWTNPASNDFLGVKIVRSPFFYPGTQNEGKVIYDGKGIYTRDSEITLDQKYYYSAFSYDKNLNYSSGVVVESILKSKNATTTEVVGEVTDTTDVTFLPVNNFVLVQGDLELPISSSTVKVYPFNELKIIIDTNRLNVGVKTLILKIQDPDSFKSFSYSFSKDSTGKFYYATIPNFFNKNSYAFTITSYDANNKELSIVKGLFDVKSATEPKSLTFTELAFISISKFWIIYSTIAVLSIILTIFLFKIKK